MAKQDSASAVRSHLIGRLQYAPQTIVAHAVALLGDEDINALSSNLGHTDLVQGTLVIFSTHRALSIDVRNQDGKLQVTSVAVPRASITALRVTSENPVDFSRGEGLPEWPWNTSIQAIYPSLDAPLTFPAPDSYESQEVHDAAARLVEELSADLARSQAAAHMRN